DGRITHLPTGIVAACQNQRSQHKNRSTAMKMLKAKLYELEVNKRDAAARVLEDSKSDVSWGNQIRSYVLDQSRIKDLRTGVEVGNTTPVRSEEHTSELQSHLNLVCRLLRRKKTSSTPTRSKRRARGLGY